MCELFYWIFWNVGTFLPTYCRYIPKSEMFIAASVRTTNIKHWLNYRDFSCRWQETKSNRKKFDLSTKNYNLCFPSDRVWKIRVSNLLLPPYMPSWRGQAKLYIPSFLKRFSHYGKVYQAGKPLNYTTQCCTRRIFTVRPTVQWARDGSSIPTETPRNWNKKWELGINLLFVETKRNIWCFKLNAPRFGSKFINAISIWLYFIFCIVFQTQLFNLTIYRQPVSLQKLKTERQFEVIITRVRNFPAETESNDAKESQSCLDRLLRAISIFTN